MCTLQFVHQMHKLLGTNNRRAIYYRDCTSGNGGCSIRRGSIAVYGVLWVMCVSQNGKEVNSVIWPGKFLHTGQTVLRAWIHILWRVTVQVPVMKGEH